MLLDFYETYFPLVSQIDSTSATLAHNSNHSSASNSIFPLSDSTIISVEPENFESVINDETTNAPNSLQIDCPKQFDSYEMLSDFYKSVGLDHKIFDAGGAGNCGPLCLAAFLNLRNWEQQNGHTEITYSEVRQLIDQHQGKTGKDGVFWEEEDWYAASCEFDIDIFIYSQSWHQCTLHYKCWL